MLVRVWRKGSLCALLVGMQIGAATVESSVEVPQKFKNRTISNSTSGYFSEERENINSERYMHPQIQIQYYLQ